MRLLNKETLELEWFTNHAPAYNVLSHRWLGPETSLQDFLVQSKQDEASQSDGVKKIVRFCKQMRSATYEERYVWVDTCCIDKTSSTELQEAINSMYRWYERAALCVVYLDDVTATEDRSKLRNRLSRSLWFTRGWTLQELIAPRNVLFLDRNWRSIGTRALLAETIEKVTSIPADCLGNSSIVHRLPIAERMKWLSGRQTTREEDLAYCMLGILDVNIPLLYGQGKRAFMRLQKEYLQTNNDESIFIWTTFDGLEAELDGGNSTSTIFAPAPACFSCVAGRNVQLDDWFDREPLRVTAKGVDIQTWDARQAQFGDSLTLPLNVTVDGKRACIQLSNDALDAEAKAKHEEELRKKRETAKVGADGTVTVGMQEFMQTLAFNHKFFSENKRWVRVAQDRIVTIEAEDRERPLTALEQFKAELTLRATQHREAENEAWQQRFPMGRQQVVRSSLGRPAAMGSPAQPRDKNYIESYRAEMIRFRVFVE